MHRALLCLRPVWVKKAGFYAGCGHCPVCRMKRKREWTMRLSHHAITAKKALYVTLTYDKEHVPDHHTLVVRDLQLFYKRLRKKLGNTKIKYFTCGEYGPKTLRPHYHAVIFGLDLSHRELVFETWGMCKRHAFKAYLITSADTKAFGYVAGYCVKKLGKHYNRRFKDEFPNRIPEFQTHSNGLGREFCETVLKLNENSCMYVNGVEMIPPRYYRKVLGLTADNYTHIIDKMQQDLDETIYRINPLARKEYTFNNDNTTIIIKTNIFYDEVEKLRKYHNELVIAQLKEWRNKL